MFNGLFSKANTRDLTLDQETMDQKEARMSRDKTFVQVHSDVTLKKIMDNARKLYFWMEKVRSSYPAGSAQAKMLTKGQGKYTTFVEVLNSDSLTYEDAVQAAVALIDGMGYVIRALDFIDGERQHMEEPVGMQDKSLRFADDIHISEDRFGTDEAALAQANSRLKELKRQRRGSIGRQLMA